MEHITQVVHHPEQTYIKVWGATRLEHLGMRLRVHMGGYIQIEHKIALQA